MYNKFPSVELNADSLTKPCYDDGMALDISSLTLSMARVAKSINAGDSIIMIVLSIVSNLKSRMSLECRH